MDICDRMNDLRRNILRTRRQVCPAASVERSGTAWIGVDRGKSQADPITDAQAYPHGKRRYSWYARPSLRLLPPRSWARRSFLAARRPSITEAAVDPAAAAPAWAQPIPVAEVAGPAWEVAAAAWAP